MAVYPSTKQRLMDALQELLTSRTFDTISVGDIAGAAGVSSRTFYNHFQDKNELLAYTYRETVEPMWFTDGVPNSLQVFFQRATEHAMDPQNRRVFVNALKVCGQNDLRSEIENKGVEDIARLLEWNRYPDEIDEELRAILHFFMCGISRESELTFINSHDIRADRLYTFWMKCIPVELAEYMMKDPAENWKHE